MGFSLGGSESKSKSSSVTTQSVWPTQGAALKNMYDAMAQLWGGMQGMQGQFGNMAEELTPQMKEISQGAMDSYQNMLGGGSYGNTDDIRNRLMDSLNQSAQGSNLGRMYQSIVGGAGNSYIDPMVDAMRSGYQENLNRNLSSGSLDAAALGQGGSSRHAMSDAMLKRDALQDMSNAEMMMRGKAYDTDLNMKMDIARQADLGVQNTQQRLMDMLAGADANTQMGMNFGDQMQNLGMGVMAPWMQAYQNPWNIMNQYAANLGDPTVLTKNVSSGSSSGFSFGGGMGGM